MWTNTGQGSAVLIAFGLGTTFGLGFGLAFCSETWVDFGLYFGMLALYHLWEYIYVALFHPHELTSNSFLINQSTEYVVAAMASWLEYLLERWMFPSMKGSFLFIFIGFSMVLGGQLMRTMAMYTAGFNFHHLVREEREKEHKLVTFGIYHYLRHPAYFGWFWWSVGTQLLLTNPICAIGYTFVSWKFFKDRIEEEEMTMVKFFGDDYNHYRAKTPVGIPWIR